MTIRNGLAPTPPLGWNSWDCYGPTVREDEVKANADFMAKHLLKHGWNTIVVDIQWYEPAAKAGGYRPNADLIMDGYGRLMPAVNRFPSAANDAGFRPLADYIHGLGIKFGIHIMRGIPRRAVSANLPILNIPFRAQDIADLERMCPWNDDMAGIDMSKPGAQAYYDSIFALYAAWEVDYIKADDMLYPYHTHEIEGVRRAIDAVNHPMVLSLSPGVDMTIDHSDHLKQHCELFRISGDFWDRWDDLKAQFEKCRVWSPYTGPGCWADADMLPLGHIGIRAERGGDRQSLLTRPEQITLMTLWVISRSPLMFGGDLPSSDSFTLKLLTNDEVIQVNQASWDNQELMCQGDQLAWTAKSPDSDDLYLALFNIGEDSATPIEIDLTILGGGTSYHIRDLWERTDLGVTHGILRETIEPHSARLYRLHRA
jgi:alpha-galactosidase